MDCIDIILVAGFLISVTLVLIDLFYKSDILACIGFTLWIADFVFLYYIILDDILYMDYRQHSVIRTLLFLSIIIGMSATIVFGTTKEIIRRN